MSPRLVFALGAAQRAGESTLPLFEAGAAAMVKDDQTPVTQADRDAEALLRQEIERAYPGEAVLGEEFGGVDADDRWVLDPIDGTKSFLCGVPLYATLVSYEVGGTPVLGVAHFPALGMTVWAESGGGAFCNGEPVRVSAIGSLAEATICCSGPQSWVREGRLDGILSLASRCRAVRTWCDAYGHCLVARGRAEAMLDPKVAAWDISAIRCIVEEAGGSFTDFSGRAAPVGQAVSLNRNLREVVLGAFAS